MGVCETFRERAFQTWAQLSGGRRCGHQIGEETVTDLNVLELKLRHPEDVFVKAFSKPDEGRVGADIEVWLGSTSGPWLGFRVQAKIIDFDTDTYPHLHYRKDRSSEFQCDLLIERALSLDTPCVPLYCLYSQWDNSTHDPPVYTHGDWCCGSFPPCIESFGCSFASAAAVRHLRTESRARDLRTVFQLMRPWHCLVCCSGYGGGDFASRAWRYWQQAILSRDLDSSVDIADDAWEGNDMDWQEILGRLEAIEPAQPPSHVDHLIAGELHERPDRDVSAIIAIRANGES